MTKALKSQGSYFPRNMNFDTHIGIVRDGHGNNVSHNIFDKLQCKFKHYKAILRYDS